MSKAAHKKILYMEVVGTGHGCHEIFAKWQIPYEKLEDFVKLIESHPEIFQDMPKELS